MDRKKWIAVALAFVVFLGGGTAWAVRHFSTSAPPPDPQVTKVASLGSEMILDVNGELTEEKLKETALKLVAEMQNMTPEQQKAAGKAFQTLMAKVVTKHISDYFELPTREEQVAQLDKDIDKMERMFGVLGPIFRLAMANRNKSEDGASASGGGEPRGGGGGPFGQGKMSPEERDKMRREMLDSSTPTQRAQFGEYSRQLMARRQERGLPTMGPRGR